MTGARPPICWVGLARAISCRPTAPMTATPCAPVSMHGEHGPLVKPVRNRKTVPALDLLRKSGEFPMTDEELHDAKETIYERV